MAALVVPGAPVSVLTDHGIADSIIDVLTAAGIATVEQLGAMTPEQLQEIPGIEPAMVETIQAAVVGYYGQFETVEGDGSASPAPAAPATEALEEQSVRIETQDSASSAGSAEAERGE
jgi:N utilization substance protein A